MTTQPQAGTETAEQQEFLLSLGELWRLIERVRHHDTDTALLAYKKVIAAHRSALATQATEISELVGALRALEPYIDSIVCYASTISEYDGNKVAKQISDIVAKHGGAA